MDLDQDPVNWGSGTGEIRLGTLYKERSTDRRGPRAGKGKQKKRKPGARGTGPQEKGEHHPA